MKIEEFEGAKDQRPFQPFLIRMANGREIQVRHPDAVAWGSETGPRMVFCIAGGEHHWIDIAMVSSQVLPVPAQLPGPNGGG